MLLRLLVAILLTPILLLAATLRLLLSLLRRPRAPRWIVVDLRGNLRWRRTKQQGFRFGKRKKTITVEGLLDRIARAAKDPNVRGFVLRPHELHAGRAQLVALREGLRESGKEVVLYLRQGAARDYILAPVAQRIWLAPGGPIHLIGYAASVSALRGLLEKLGIEPEFFRKGRYKVAPERFTHDEVSDEQRDFVERVLDHHHRELVADLAARTGGDAEKARALIDSGPHTSRRALEAGLVDDLVYPDQLAEKLGCERAELAGFGRLDARQRWRMRWPVLKTPPRIAIVPLHGLIKPGKSVRWPGGSKLAGDESIAEALEQARKDRRVRAVLVHVDSRGGAASASELMWRSIARCAGEKPTVAYVEQVAASGGYFAAAGARHIVAAPGALVGSIGVFSGRFSAARLLQRLGIANEIVRRGENSALLEPGHRLGESERRTLQAEVDAIYEEFVERVAEGRRRAPEEIRAYAEGRVFVAAQAPAALVDEVGDFRAALAWIGREAGVDPATAELVRIEKVSVKPDLGALFAMAREFEGQALLLDPDWPRFG